MAIIPLRQTVEVRKPIPDDGDGWHEEGYGEPTVYKVRATERVEIVTNKLGEERASTVKLYFNKMPDISYNDEITFVNELGVEFKREPLSIRPLRLINGKPTLTVVFL